MKKIYCFLFVLASISSKAQFSAAYSPTKWTTNLSGNSNGSVNSSGAPNSITISGSDGGGGSDADINYTVTSIATGVWTFNWTYHSNDLDAAPGYDIAGVLINGVFTQLTDDAGSIDQSGNFSQSVTVGTVIGFRIRATDNTAGNATFTISNFGPPAGVLPIQFSLFNGKQDGGQIVLNWTSSKETSLIFGIDHSYDGIHFENLSEVGGSTAVQYRYVDRNPVEGMNYYRVFSVDAGHKTYSSIIAVVFKGSERLNIYPNPATGFVMVPVDKDHPGMQKLIITNTSGMIMKTQIVSVQRNEGYKQINISSLSTGIYMIKTEKEKVYPFIKR